MIQELIKDFIPVAKLGVVEKAFIAVFGEDYVQEIELLTGGLSSALVYKVTVNGRYYLLRIIMHVDPLNDPYRQYTCMELASKHGIAPETFYANPEDALSITQYIENRPVNESFPSKNDFLVKLVKTVKEMHALPLFPKLVGFMDGVDIFIQIYKDQNILPEYVTFECFKLYREIQGVYPRHNANIVSSHNDLNPNNILYDGRKIWIIDWESAFQSDQYVDLAIVAKSFADSPAGEEILLKAYFGDGVDDYVRARFFLMQQVANMYYAMLMLRFAGGMKPAEFIHDPDMSLPTMAEFTNMIRSKQISLEQYDYKLIYGKLLIKTMLNNMQSERFKESIRIIAA